MPYNYSGVPKIENLININISRLFKTGAFEENKNVNAHISWKINEKEYAIGIETMLKNPEKWIRFHYTTITEAGTKTRFDYKVYLDVVKSNLGKGNVYYFICPETTKMCRNLYFDFNDLQFKSRYAFRKVYYRSQTISRTYYPTYKCFELEKVMDKMKNTRLKTTYRGRITKTFVRYYRITKKYEHYNKLRCNSIIESLAKIKTKYR